MLKNPRVLAIVLLAVNVSIAWRLFSTEFTQHMNSNEGTFMAISRFLIADWPHTEWFPLWLNGIPFENTYSPLLQVVDALLAHTLHVSTALAFHAVGAFFYCLGPVCLFWLAWRMSGALYASFLAALLYSLTSPSVVFPLIRVDAGGWLEPRRLQTLVHYGEGAHNTVLSLLPLALLCAWLALESGRIRWYFATGALAGAMALTNCFGAVDLAIGILCLVAVRPDGERLRGLASLAITGVIAYVWISPYLPPSLLHTISMNSAAQGYGYTPRVIGTALLVLAGAFVIWLFTKRLQAIERFSLLFGYLFCAIPAVKYCAGIDVLPQAERYHMEMEMGVCLAMVFTTWRLPARVRTGLAILLLIALIPQYRNYRLSARAMIQRIDITQTIEYKTARWLTQNLPGQKAMVSGDVGFWFSVFSDNPQFGSGHDPFSPNWMVEIAVYGMYVTADAQPAITWLKAYGCQAITVPGPQSREVYKPFRNPYKFEGVLPLLWRVGDDSVYGVPQRSRSLAHVVPEGALVRRPPYNGIDLGEVNRFVTALENPKLPLATFDWGDSRHARIRAPLKPGQAIAVQVTYAPGWVATMNAQPVAITRDGIGLMTLHPECSGPCEIDLAYEGSLEGRMCRALSVLTMLGLAAAALYRWLLWRKTLQLRIEEIARS